MTESPVRTFVCSKCDETFVSLHPDEMQRPPVCYWCALGPQPPAEGWLKPMIERVIRIMAEQGVTIKEKPDGGA